ncbi:MAG: dethiobiotin synthase [Lentisphaerae bacterium RIFOXYA12_FULL_48_11]|nr:MAG: dethiobiotin synthase [Lentisphaerae bacterium RIFOXYA12_FULL_48_11]
MNKGLFITGTDTGVGKTVVSSILLASLRQSGIDAVPMKPVQTGCTSRKGKLVAPDLEFMLDFAGIKPDKISLNLMCPYKFKPECSPHLAATMAGKPISLSRIMAAFKKLTRKHQVVIAEGAGGVLAPVSDRKTMLNLMKLLNLPIILVARPGLGTINHTLLSIREIRRARLELKGVIFNQTKPGNPGYIEKDNMKIIARLGKVKILGFIPFTSEAPRGLPRGILAKASEIR